MGNHNNDHRLHIDGCFAMEFKIFGEDEHGLPLLEVNFYPITTTGVNGDGRAVAVDSRHLVATLTQPLEEAGLRSTDMDALPLRKDWAIISTVQSVGLQVEDLEGTFGPRAAAIILKVLADALLSEAINADWQGTPYRETRIPDNRYEEILTAYDQMQKRIEVEEDLRVMREAFSRIITREFTR